MSATSPEKRASTKETHKLLDLREQGQIQHLVSSSSLRVQRVLVSQRNLPGVRSRSAQLLSTDKEKEEGRTGLGESFRDDQLRKIDFVREQV